MAEPIKINNAKVNRKTTIPDQIVSKYALRFEVPVSIELVKSVPDQKLLYTETDMFTNFETMFYPSADLSMSEVDACAFDKLEKFVERQYRPNVKTKDLSKVEREMDLRHIYVLITYPVTKHALFKFSFRDHTLTYEDILRANIVAHQMMYEIEDHDVGHPTGYIGGMLNRQESNGRFGIWGHVIDDLMYNGISAIDIYKTCVVCHFNCDS